MRFSDAFAAADRQLNGLALEVMRHPGVREARRLMATQLEGSLHRYVLAHLSDGRELTWNLVLRWRAAEWVIEGYVAAPDRYGETCLRDFGEARAGDLATVIDALDRVASAVASAAIGSLLADSDR